MSGTVRTLFGIVAWQPRARPRRARWDQSLQDRLCGETAPFVLGIGRGRGRALVSQDRSRNYLFTVINSGRMIRRTIITRRLPAQLSFNGWCLDVARGLAHGRR
jgi:hypothetical protein